MTLVTTRRPLVRIRCGRSGCRRVVSELYEEPTDWTAKVRLEPCPKHDAQRDVFVEARRQHAKGYTPSLHGNVRFVPWAQLRHALWCAARTGRTQEVLSR